jgi:hypothetical protein
MYNGRGTKRAYQEWLRDMAMDIVESGEIPAVAAAVIRKIEDNTRPATPEHRFFKGRPYRTSNE